MPRKLFVMQHRRVVAMEIKVAQDITQTFLLFEKCITTAIYLKKKFKKISCFNVLDIIDFLSPTDINYLYFKCE